MKKILIVDDVFDNIKVVMNYLQELSFTLYFAVNGKEALAKLPIVKPDLILMDVMMPDLNGYETVEQIKSNAEFRDIPIIFLTAKSEPEDIVKGFEVGGVDYITKPIFKQELIARVSTHLKLVEYQKVLEKKLIDEKEKIEYLKMTQKQLVQSEKMASLGALVAGVAHEINTPLGIGITGITHLNEITDKINKLYKNANMSENDFQNFLDNTIELTPIIYLNLERAAALIRSFKRIAIDQSSDEKREFNLRTYIEEVLLSLRNIIKQSKHNIVINCAEDIMIDSYPGSFSQIVTNLIMNSINHAFEKDQIGNLEINIEEKDKQIILIYKDNGRGMNQEIVDKIFEPFFTTNRAKGGSGLGLSIVYNIVKSNFKGEIICESEKNKGTKFILTLNF